VDPALLNGCPLTAAADVYSLGATLWHLATGIEAGGAAGAAGAARAARARALPRALAALIGACMEGGGRRPTAADVAARAAAGEAALSPADVADADARLRAGDAAAATLPAEPPALHAPHFKRRTPASAPPSPVAEEAWVAGTLDRAESAMSLDAPPPRPRSRPTSAARRSVPSLCATPVSAPAARGRPALAPRPAPRAATGLSSSASDLEADLQATVRHLSMSMSAMLGSDSEGSLLSP